MKIKKLFLLYARAVLEMEEEKSLMNLGCKEYQIGENIRVLCKPDNFLILDKVVKASQDSCQYNKFNFNCHIKTIIECPKEFKGSFMGKAICPENIEKWKDCSNNDFRRYVSYFINHALLSKEFTSGSPWIAIYGKKKVKLFKQISKQWAETWEERNH